MSYPSKNNSIPSFSSKNSSSFGIGEQSGQNFLEIGDGFILLIDSDNKLLLENLTSDWSYATKN